MMSVIAAVSENGVIGNGPKIPWHLPADFAYFKRVTKGHSVVMGMRTFQSIGKPLPERKNIVLTRDPAFKAEGCVMAGSIEEAIQAAGEGEIFFLGGGEVFRQILPYTDRVYLTRVHAHVKGDVFFPEMNFAEWREVRREEGVVDEKNAIPHTFLVYERVRI
ncbi:MAG: dihydrofolate reductase [Candidatus Liptonbacteria bacterium]|nr:dihydrofolate reductase [Candidatus Liptonbacteria bacterium]